MGVKDKNDVKAANAVEPPKRGRPAQVKREEACEKKKVKTLKPVNEPVPVVGKPMLKAETVSKTEKYILNIEYCTTQK